jgi:hypothetical protein
VAVHCSQSHLGSRGVQGKAISLIHGRVQTILQQAITSIQAEVSGSGSASPPEGEQGPEGGTRPDGGTPTSATSGAVAGAPAPAVSSTLLCVRFRAIVEPQLTPLVSELLKSTGQSEYMRLLRNIEGSFCAERIGLILPFVRQHVARIQASHDLLNLARYAASAGRAAGTRLQCSHQRPLACHHTTHLAHADCMLLLPPVPPSCVHRVCTCMAVVMACAPVHPATALPRQQHSHGVHMRACAVSSGTSTASSAGVCRYGVAYMLDICRVELGLVAVFFPEPFHPSAQVDLVDAVCNVLFDALRPQYIHLQAVDELVALVDVLRQAVRSDALTHRAAQASSLVEAAVSRITQDVQERLIFRSAVRPSCAVPPLPHAHLAPCAGQTAGLQICLGKLSAHCGSTPAIRGQLQVRASVPSRAHTRRWRCRLSCGKKCTASSPAQLTWSTHSA